MDELVEIDVRELQALINEFERRGKSFSRITPTVASILTTAVEDEFNTEGHGQWPPLSAATVAKRRGTTAMILQDTGNLAGSMRPDHGSDWGAAATDVPYAIFHVSSAPRSKIPLRDFLAVDTPDVLDEIGDLLAYELVEL